MSKIFTWSLCFLFILQSYSIKGIPLCTILVGCGAIVCVINSIAIRKIHVFVPLIIISLFTVFYSIFQNLFIENTNVNVIDLGHYVFYCLIIGVFSADYFNIDLAYKINKGISIFSATYAFLQFIIFKVFGLYLRGDILPFFDSSVANYYENITDSYSLRVYSIFAEPSHFGIFIGFYLLVYLIIKNNKK